LTHIPGGGIFPLPLSRYRSGIRAIRIGIATNALLSAVKLIAGILGNSYALIADAVESMSDILTSAVAWGGLALSRIPADSDHPYGHGKAEPLSGAVISLVILAAAAGIAVQAVREILAPHHPIAWFTLVVLVAVIVVKEALARYLRKVGREIDSNALCGDAWNQRSDAITSALRERSVEVARAQEGVAAVEKNWLRKVGSQYFFDLHIEVDPEMTVRESHLIAHRVSEAVRGAFPEIMAVTVHVEPHGDPPPSI
jgi:divalent metal cation (Fe/Co/Zn/Cd) transporter